MKWIGCPIVARGNGLDGGASPTHSISSLPFLVAVGLLMTRSKTIRTRGCSSRQVQLAASAPRVLLPTTCGPRRRQPGAEACDRVQYTGSGSRCHRLGSRSLLGHRRAFAQRNSRGNASPASNSLPPCTRAQYSSCDGQKCHCNNLPHRKCAYSSSPAAQRLC